MGACGGRTHPKAFIFLPGARLGPMSRLYEPLVVALHQWLTRGGIRVDVVDRAKRQHYAHFCSTDVAILVGPDIYTPAHDRYPLARLGANGTNLIVYNTEPLASQTCSSAPWHFLRRAAAAARNGLELWDYSHANIKALRANVTRCVDHFGHARLAAGIADGSVPMRFVPPGWHASLSFRKRARRGLSRDADTRLFFLGQMQYRARRCWNVLNRSNWLAKHFVASSQTWGTDGYRRLFSQFSMFANFHRSCENARSPLETFRLSLLLSNGASVISELSDPDDMAVYHGFVHFCEFAAVPSCHERLRRTALPAWEQVQRRFAANFSLASTLERARAAEGVLAPLLAAGARAAALQGRGTASASAVLGDRVPRTFPQ